MTHVEVRHSDGGLGMRASISPGDRLAMYLRAATLLVLGAALPLPASAQRVASADSLLAAGRYQEAAWAARAAGDTVRADSILRALRALLVAPPERANPLSLDSQGVSYTFRLTHPGGVESIFKVDGSDIFCRPCGANREVAAYRVDRLLGIDLTPMTVLQRIVAGGDTMAGSAMYFIRGATTPAERGERKPDLLRFFDAAIGNSDRHGGNWLVAPGGHAVAIDHNRAFDYSPARQPMSCWETEVDSIERPGALGPPFDRYRTLPDDSLEAAVAGLLEPRLARRFVAMRDSVVARIEARARDPRRALPLRDCRREDTGIEESPTVHR